MRDSAAFKNPDDNRFDPFDQRQSYSASYFLKGDIRFFNSLVVKGGPERDEYAELKARLQKVGVRQLMGFYSDVDLERLRFCFKPIHKSGSLFDLLHSFRSGHRKMPLFLDRVYFMEVSHNIQDRKWDMFFQDQDIMKLYQERFGSISEYIKARELNSDIPLNKLLFIGHFSGKEFQQPGIVHSDNEMKIDLVTPALRQDQESKRSPIKNNDQISWISSNLYDLSLGGEYDFIWVSAYLDWADEGYYRNEIKRLSALLAPGGMLVIPCYPAYLSSYQFLNVVCNWSPSCRNKDQLNEWAGELSTKSISSRVKSGSYNLFQIIEKNL